MKILFTTYPMAHQTPGGGEIQAHYYKKYLTKLGHKVSYFNQWKDKIKDYDIVHFFSCIAGSEHFCNYVKSQGKPLVISPNLWITDKNKHEYDLPAIKNIFNLADKIVCNSKIEIEILRETFSHSKRFFDYVYNGVDPKFFKRADPNIFRKKFNINFPFLLNVANIEKRKNQLNLVRSCNNLGINLVIIGNIRDNQYFKKIKKLDKNNYVTVISNVQHNSKILKAAYAACSYFVLPSILETPGLSSLEAAASGKNILITAEGSTSEYFKKNVLYCSDDMDEKLSKLIQKDKLSKELKNYAKNYQWNKCILRLDKLYKRLK